MTRVPQGLFRIGSLSMGTLPAIFLLIGSLIATPAQAIESAYNGLIDLRYSYVDGNDSYVEAGLGKFRYNDGSNLSIAQLGLAVELEWDNDLSLHVVVNGYGDGIDDSLGFTELYFNYRTLPSTSGFRQGFKAGIFYPVISLENQGTAWSTTATLTPSTLNSWVGEELRSTGVDYTGEWLGKFNERWFDLKLRSSLFVNNDPAGAMLSWHGWTQSSRQTLLHEKLPLPDFPARSGALSSQAANSDAFHEEDNRLGYTFSGEFKVPGKGLFQLGYFNNRAQPYRETNGQYGWDTQFIHGGFKWRFANNFHLSGQFLEGKTLMQSPQRVDIVNNDYRSAFLTLGWSHKSHRLTGRIEEFSVTDNDSTLGDDNNDYGKVLTLSYRYRQGKARFFFSEFNWINSHADRREYMSLPSGQIERQLQFGLRQYF